MTDQEAKLQSERIARYQTLVTMREATYAAIKTITEGWEEGPCGQGPFTGNTRESRKVLHMKIWFSATQGGSAPVEMTTPDLNISAYELGQWLEGRLRVKLNAIKEEIEKI